MAEDRPTPALFLRPYRHPRIFGIGSNKFFCLERLPPTQHIGFDTPTLIFARLGAYGLKVVKFARNGSS